MRVREARACAAVVLGAGALVLVSAGRAEAAPEGAGSEGAGSSLVDRPARPPLPEVAAPVPLPWERHLELGAAVAFVALPAHGGGDGGGDGGAGEGSSLVRFAPGVGFGVHVGIDVLRYLRFEGYLVDSRHALELPAGSLGVSGAIASDWAHTFRLGVRFSPMVSLSARVRAWASVGAGWGRVEFGRMTVAEAGAGGGFVVRERGDSVLELPVGVGASFEVVKGWLRVQLESTYGVGVAQYGSGVEAAQAVDSAGRKRGIGGLPRVDGFLVQTVGVSLML